MRERSDKDIEADIDGLLGEARDKERKRSARTLLCSALLPAALPVLVIGTTVTVIGLAVTVKAIGVGLDLWNSIKKR